MQALSSQIIENKALMFAAAAVAFFVAAVLILLVFRLAFGRRLHMAGGRTRQMRLGIVDAFDLDRQRQLVLIRRDNIEHLIMIGGPTDLLIESQIVRSEMRTREKEAREPTHVAAATSKVAAAEAKLPPELQPAAAMEPTAAATITPLPGLPAHPVPAGKVHPQPTTSPIPTPTRRQMPTPPSFKPMPAQDNAAAEAKTGGGTSPASATSTVTPVPAPHAATTPKPAASPTHVSPAFMRWPTKPPGTNTLSPTAAPKRPETKPAAPHPQPRPEQTASPEPAAAPSAPTLEGLESLEEEMAKLLGRTQTKP